jgi:aminopeptidase N
MTAATTQTTYLKNYQPPAYLVTTLELEFDLEPEATIVTATGRYQRNPQGPAGDLTLFGEELELLALELDGTPLATDRYRLTGQGLTLREVPAEFALRSVVKSAS